jgi:hypothetical protein
MPVLDRTRFPFVLILLFIPLLLLLAAACGGDDEPDSATATPGDESPAAEDLSGETVDALGIWGEEELAALERRYRRGRRLHRNPGRQFNLDDPCHRR